jgi:hypothetical protein
MTVESVFENLWSVYTRTNPKVLEVHRALSGNGADFNSVQSRAGISNDHIALRTLQHPAFGIERLASVFYDLGYEVKGRYRFEEKKLDALHLEHALHPHHPKVFISELCVGQCSQRLQEIVQGGLFDKLSGSLESNDLLPASGAHWGKPSYKVYQQLLDESEYAAWFYVYGFVPNHFTVRVNDLERFATIQELNAFLEQQGFVLNSAGGKVKGTPEVFLEQSSTMADLQEIEFQEGLYAIPSVFYEFAQRHIMSDGEEFSGFIEGNADKIFESTNAR